MNFWRRLAQTVFDPRRARRGQRRTRSRGSAPLRPVDPGQDFSEVVAPFSVPRLESVIARDGYSCYRDPDAGVVVGTWNDVEFRFLSREERPWLRIVSAWDAPALGGPERSFMALQDASNEWNRMYLQPTAYPDQSGGRWHILFEQILFVDEGVSDRQIHLMLDRALNVGLQAHDEIPNLLPPLV